MSTPRPRVFVSSVMQGFELFRDAARAGVQAGACEPVMAEDWPSLAHSSRTACLDGVASADAFVLVVGERGGWTAPSGKLVVEEEWEEAQRRKLPVRVFVQDGVVLDAAAARLAAAVSDYVGGHFRRTFTDPATLAAEIERSLQTIEPLPSHAMTTSADALRTLALTVGVQTQGNGVSEKTLRFVLAPERAGEVVDPRVLDDAVFHHQVMTAAQSPAHRIVAYGQPVVPHVRGTALVLEEAAPPQNWRVSRAPRVEVHEDGLILVDTPLETRNQNGGMGTIPSHVLDEGLIETAITSSFRFAGAVYGLVDAYGRYERFQVDIALAGVRGGVLERDPQPRSSYTIPFESMSGGHGAAGPVVPLQTPRLVVRRDLEDPDGEVERAMIYLRRALAP